MPTNELPRTGTRHELAFVVEPSHTITFAGLPPILSTPALLWHLEQAALQLLLPFLSQGQITVGTSVEIEHTGPALVGDEVRCAATVIRGEGKDVTFRVEAHLGSQEICRGLHRRRIASIESLKKRLTR